MKKLYFAGIGIVLLLLFSFWAKNADFNLKTMMQTPIKTLTPSGSPSQVQVTTALPIEIFITVTPYGFVPDVLTIHPGTKITWMNKSGNDANISAEGSSVADLPALTLGNFWNNASISLTFTKLGRYRYYNHLYPTQHGVIIVN